MIGKLSPHDRETLICEYLSGVMPKVIASRYGVTIQRVFQILNASGVRKPAWTWSDTAKVEKIVQLRANGLSLGEIGAEVGMSREGVRRILDGRRKTV